jgi:hypothetical protein
MNTQIGIVLWLSLPDSRFSLATCISLLLLKAVKNVPSSGQAIRKSKILIKLKDTNLCIEPGKIVPQIDINGRKLVGLPLFDIDF